MDASGSVGKGNWQKVLDFAGKLAERLLALNRENRMEIIDFSQEANEDNQLSSNQTVIHQGLQNLKNRYQNAITRTGKALNKESEIFKRLSRDGTNKLLIVVTDGQTTPQNSFTGLELLRGPTEDLKAAGVHVTAVGVGTMVNEEELNFMATDPDNKNVLHFDNYDGLLNMVDKVSQAICPASITNGMKHWFCLGFCAFVVCMKNNQLFFFRESMIWKTITSNRIGKSEDFWKIKLDGLAEQNFLRFFGTVAEKKHPNCNFGSRWSKNLMGIHCIISWRRVHENQSRNSPHSCTPLGQASSTYASSDQYKTPRRSSRVLVSL